MPDCLELPAGSDISVELYGNALSLRLDGEKNRVYIGRFTYLSFSTYEEARLALLDLWRRIELLDSVSEAGKAMEEWHRAGQED